MVVLGCLYAGLGSGFQGLVLAMFLRDGFCGCDGGFGCFVFCWLLMVTDLSGFVVCGFCVLIAGMVFVSLQVCELVSAVAL